LRVEVGNVPRLWHARNITADTGATSKPAAPVLYIQQAS
jgi:hypothetical protein